MSNIDQITRQTIAALLKLLPKYFPYIDKATFEEDTRESTLANINTLEKSKDRANGNPLTSETADELKKALKLINNIRKEAASQNSRELLGILNTLFTALAHIDSLPKAAEAKSDGAAAGGGGAAAGGGGAASDSDDSKTTESSSKPAAKGGCSLAETITDLSKPVGPAGLLSGAIFTLMGGNKGKDAHIERYGQITKVINALNLARVKLGLSELPTAKIVHQIHEYSAKQKAASDAADISAHAAI